MGKKIKVGLYGVEGHQIHNELNNHPKAEAVALCGFPSNQIPSHLKEVRVVENLGEMLADKAIDFISFCSPFKDEQGEQIIQALEAGKHVYAEKPCCLSEIVLDRILDAARRAERRFHEMNGSSLAQPYCTLRDIVRSGGIGEVVQVLSQKSYPWMERRPGDERVDGGLARQVGIYNVRFAEQVAGMKIDSLDIRETRLGNDHPGSDCRRAVSMLMTFVSGAVGSAVANYCCPQPPGWNRWGYEILRIFGTKGFVDSVDNGRTGTLALTGREPRSLDFSRPGQDILELFFDEIKTGTDCVPFTIQEEFSPLRWVLRCKSRLGNV